MKFRKKPVVIEAVQWLPSDNGTQRPSWPKEFSKCREFKVECIHLSLLIPTLEGVMMARVGDWIIRGVQGEFYPYKPDIFAAMYEPATPSHAAKEKP